MKTQSWNIEKDGIHYTIDVAKEVTVTPGETYKLNKLKRTGNMLDWQYEIPVCDSTVALHIDAMGKRSLVVDGIDQATGKEYQTAPKWTIVFVVLYIINFFAFLGGALGGAINFIMIAISAKIASDTSKKVAVRAIICSVLYALVTIGEIVLAIGIATAIY